VALLHVSACLHGHHQVHHNTLQLYAKHQQQELHHFTSFGGRFNREQNS